MKDILVLLFSLISFSFLAAQAPQKFNYQAVVRDNVSGGVLASESLDVKISILDALGVTLYVEEHLQKTTNNYGLLDMEIGGGNPLQGGNLANVNWAIGNKFLKIEVRKTGGNYTSIGFPDQLLSVPYALFAQNAGNGSGGSTYTAGDGIDITNNEIINTGDTDASDDITNTSNTGGDLSGTFGNLQISNSAVGSDEIANGAVQSSEIGNGAIQRVHLSNMGASNGQVLKWDSNTNAWTTSDDLTGGGGTVGGDLTGPLSSLNINQGVVGSLEITDNAIQSTDIADGAIQSIDIQDKTITGNDLGQMGASEGQVLKWSNSQNNWIPQNDNTGGTGGNPGGDLSGTIDNLQIISGAVGSNEIADGSIQSNDIGDGAVQSADIQNGTIQAVDLSSMGAGVNQVLKWNGGAWAPADDATGGSGGPVGGDLTGTISDLQLKPNVVTNAEILDYSIGQNDLGSMGASSGQVLKWNGALWAPAQDATGSGPTYTGGNGITISGGNTINSTWTVTGADITNNNSGDVVVGPSSYGFGRIQAISTNTIDEAGVFEIINSSNPYAAILARNAGSGPAIIAQSNSTTDNATIELVENTAGNPARVKFGNNNQVESWNITTEPNDNNSANAYMNFFYSGYGTILSLQGAGNVGIGTNTPGNYRLKIRHGGFGLNLENSANSNNWEIYPQHNNENLGLYRNGANSAIGTFNGITGAYTSISDRRFKTNIQSIGTVVPAILKLTPKSYEFIDNNPNHEKSIGFIAQEVEAIFPELVSKNTDKKGDEYLTLNYDGFSVLAIKAIQEQQQIIDSLKEQLEKMEQRLKDLEKKK